MKSILKWIIALIILAGIVAMILSQELDFEQFLKWEFILLIIVSIILLFVLKWRRSMRIEETTVSIQFLDD